MILDETKRPCLHDLRACAVLRSRKQGIEDMPDRLPPLGKYASRTSVAAYFGISIRTVDSLLAAGEIDAAKVGAATRILVETVDAYFERRLLHRRKCA